MMPGAFEFSPREPRRRLMRPRTPELATDRANNELATPPFASRCCGFGCFWREGSQHLGFCYPQGLHQRAGDFTAQLEAQADESKAVAIPLPAGSAMFHHCQTLHRTLPNTSPNPRRAFVMHYMAADTRKDGKLMPEHVLVRGESMS